MGILLQSDYFQIWNAHFNLSKSTKQKYKIALKRFEAFLEKEGFEGKLDFNNFHASRSHPDRFLPIQREVFERFVLDLRKMGLLDRLIAETITPLRGFFEFLQEMDLIERNPLIGYPRPKFESPIQNTALSIEECHAILRVALLIDPFYRQEFVFIWFMLVTGLRNSEVRFLRRKRLNLETQIVHVFDAQKTEQRPVAIPIELSIELERYTQHPNYLKYAKQGDEFLFNYKGKRMTENRINQLLDLLVQSAGLSRNLRPHDLRRTAGYLMQLGGMNIVEIQKQLRHQDLGTTLRYVPPLIELSRLLEDQ